MKQLIVLAAVMLAVALPLAAADDMTADQILDSISETMEPEQAHGKVRMTIQTSTGEERTFLYETFSKGKGDKSLIKYLEPSRVKGQSILMLNDANDIWTYFPRTKRVRKLATHARKQKLEGSDFSYEDMGGGDEFREEFKATRLKNERVQGRPCHKLELLPHPALGRPGTAGAACHPLLPRPGPAALGERAGVQRRACGRRHPDAVQVLHA